MISASFPNPKLLPLYIYTGDLLLYGELYSDWYPIFLSVRIDGCIDGFGLYVLFNVISVISGQWKGEYERLGAMKRRLGLERISPPAGFKP